MSDVEIRTEGRAGRITLNRPEALNALTWEMCLEIERALDSWAGEPGVALVLIDGAGDKAFCAGGDIAEMYARGRAGDFAYGQRFWANEYRLNAKLTRYAKPVASFLHGYTMGGGVGIGCHGSHRIVGETSRIAMPECGIGLVPDVGGSLLLARAPGRIGEYLGLTGNRIDAADAIFAGFADHLVPEAEWGGLKARLTETGDVAAIAAAARPPGASRLAGWQGGIDRVFCGARLGDIYDAVPQDPAAPIAHAMELMDQNSPLSMACALEIIRRVKARPEIGHALEQEARFTFRALEHGDFLEGIRAQIIDRDRSPRWRHAGWRDLRDADVLRMTLPLGDDASKLELAS